MDGMVHSAQSDYGPPEQWRQDDEYLQSGEAGRPYRKRKHPSVVDWYRDRGHISQPMYEAAERLLHDYMTACLEPHVVCNYGEHIPTGMGPYSAEQWSLRRDRADKDYRNALAALGPVHRPVVRAVVIEGQRAPRNRLWMLRKGLRRLAMHYGMIRGE